MKYWILEKPSQKASITVDNSLIVLKNGLVERRIDLNIGTVEFKNLTEKFDIIKKPCSDSYYIINQEKVDIFKEMQFKEYSFIDCIKDIDCNKKDNLNSYPPLGKAIKLVFINEKIKAEIIYEIYDGIPVICKRNILTNLSDNNIILNRYILDELIVNSKESQYLYAETNYNGGSMLNSNRKLSVYQQNDLFKVEFDGEIDIEIKPNESFIGMRAYELMHTAKYYEQRLIEVKEMYRHICPWVLENPLIFHMLSDRSSKIKKAIDMAEEVGFDMVLQSFGSGLNMESCRKSYIAKHKKLNDYAHNKGIKMGGYTLAIVKNYRPINGDECNIYADPKGRIFRCLATEWSEKYWNRIINFCEKTHLDGIEIDGPYHFYRCNGGKTHKHKNLNDSRYIQWKKSTVEVFKKFKQNNIYINAPDWLFLNGCNKSGIGYEEIAFSEKRKSQLISSRIYNYKGTFLKIPSMAWSFLPIDVYHGGGKDAAFSPLEENYKDYDFMVFQHFVAGVIPCFRGKKLYEGEKSKEIIKKWTKFYKRYQNVINGITVHFMPPRIDSKDSTKTIDLDTILNLTPHGEVRGVLAVFNQTDKDICKKIKVPLFYSGLTDGKVLPTPHANCHIADVKNPIYGKYPPPFPVYKEEDKVDSDLVTGMGECEIVDKEVYPIVKPIKTDYKVKLIREDKECIIANIDSNCDCELEIKLPSMSYTWYIIKPI